MNIAESRKLAAEAKALADGATEGEWKSRDKSRMAPALVVCHFRDEEGRRCTAFLATCSSTTADNDANAKLFAASRTLVPDLADRLVAALDRVEELEADSKYAKFGRLVVENIAQQNDWWGDEWSTEIMPLAVDAGLAEYGPYDPDVHGPNAEAEPGEDIWFWTPLRRQEEAENV